MFFIVKLCCNACLIWETLGFLSTPFILFCTLNIRLVLQQYLFRGFNCVVWWEGVLWYRKYVFNLNYVNPLDTLGLSCCETVCGYWKRTWSIYMRENVCGIWINFWNLMCWVILWGWISWIFCGQSNKNVIKIWNL